MRGEYRGSILKYLVAMADVKKYVEISARGVSK